MNSYCFIEDKHVPMLKMGTALALFIGITQLTACETPEQRVAIHEDHLAAAGFVVRPANTPERIAMLNRLPTNHFVKHLHGDSYDYVYADPLVCGCLYVGTEQAYSLYKRDQQQRHLANEQRMTAEMYSDSNWNWGAWSPGYSFGYGPGMGW